MGNCCSGLIGNNKQKEKQKNKRKNQRHQNNSKKNAKHYLDYYDDDFNDATLDQSPAHRNNNNNNNKLSKNAKKYYAASDLASQTKTSANYHSNLYKNAKLIQQNHHRLAGGGGGRRGDNSQIINNINNSKNLAILTPNTNDSSSTTGLLLNSSSSIFNNKKLDQNAILNNNVINNETGATILEESCSTNENEQINANKNSSPGPLIKRTKLQSSSSNSFSSGSQRTNPEQTGLLLKLRKRDHFLNHSLNETDRNLKQKLTKQNDTCYSSQVVYNEEDDEESISEDESSSNKKLNSKTYRSLQKSKRSIKTLEETMKNSRSIEQWLNDFGKLQQQQNIENSKSKLFSKSMTQQKRKSSIDEEILCQKELETQEQDEAIEIEEEDIELKNLLNETSLQDSNRFKSFLHQLISQGCTSCHNIIKLIDTLGHLMKLNQTTRINLIEKQMFKYLEKFIVPRSLANSEDIDYLKWLLNESNFRLTLSMPILNESIYTMDHLSLFSQTNFNYMLTPANLNVNLVESTLEDDLDEEEQDYELTDIQSYDPKTTNFIKFLLTNQENEEGYLMITNKKLESYLNKEKELQQVKVVLNDSVNNNLVHEWEKFKSLILNDSNYKAAKCLLNIKNKQILNRKTTTTTNLLVKNSPIKSTSLGSSSLSPPSSTSSLSNNKPDLLKSTSSNGSGSSCSTNSYNISYSDLNEKLFSCLLSNFSCKLVDTFLNSQANLHQLQNTGFIRKQKLDKSFTFINISNEPSSVTINNSNQISSPNKKINKHHLFNFNIDSNTIKFYVKLNKWPQSYTKEFFKRKRLNQKWPSKNLLDYLEKNTCLITTCNSSEEDIWQLDVSLAETILFKSMNHTQSFLFYLFYLIFENLQINLQENLKLNLFHFINQKMFMHHFYRFCELNHFDLTDSDLTIQKSVLQLFDLIKKFTQYLKFVFEKYKTFNKPNYFDLNKSILNKNDYDLHLLAKINNVDINVVDDQMESGILNALKQFENVLDSKLIFKLNKSNGALINNLNQFDTFLDLIQIRFSNINMNSNNNLMSTNIIQSNKLKNYTSLETIIEKHNLNSSQSSSGTSSPSSNSLQKPNKQNQLDTKYYSPLMPHYSANTYVYMYIYEYFNALFEQFKSKRDHFQISEKLLLELHYSIIEKNDQNVDNNMFIEMIKNLDRDKLFSKFEEYAECVHKYLPQIRQHNQYLLFHYIWTMQVQYLGPFFNYLCDFYPSIN